MPLPGGKVADQQPSRAQDFSTNAPISENKIYKSHHNDDFL
jgi:hypothetical protein